MGENAHDGYLRLVVTRFYYQLLRIGCTGAIALVNVLTQPVILEQEKIALQNNINELIKPDRYDNKIIDTCFTVVDANLLGDEKPKQVFMC